MKKLKQLSLMVLLLVTFISATAQNQILVQSVLAPPYPVYFSQVTELPGLVTIVLQNTDMNNSYTVRMRIKLDGHNGIVATLPQSVAPSSPLTLAPGETKTIYGVDISNMYTGLGINNIQLTGLKVENIIQSQRLPDGFYSVCVQVFDNESLKPLSGEEPTGCSNKMQIITAEPPVIQFPLNNVDIEAMTPQQLIIRWTNVNAFGSPIVYDLRMVEVPEGVSAYDAMESQNLLFYEQEGIVGNVFSYGPAQPALVSGKTYAVRIRARASVGTANIGNDGKSEIIKFLYYDDPNKGAGLPMFCGGNCPSPPSVVNNELATQLLPGDIFKAGFFSIRVINAIKQGNGFTGNGVIVPMGFFRLPVRVSFDKIGVNKRMELFGGVVKAAVNEAVDNVDCYNNQGYFNPTDDDDMNQIYNTLISSSTGVAVAMSSSAAVDDDGVRLPISFDNGQNPLLIIGMNLTAQGATMNMVSGYEMSGDYQASVKRLVFGVNDVCVTLAGPAGGAANNKIVLLNDVEFSPSSQYSILLRKGDLMNQTGCFGNISCNGVSNLNLDGQVSFSTSSVLPEDGNQQVIQGKRLAARFAATTPDPNNFKAELIFNGTSMMANAVISNRFRLRKLTDYSFRTQRLFLDYSTTSNYSGMAFPENYPGIVGNAWQGIYAPQFFVYMPNYFNTSDTNRVTINGSKLIYDDGGYSVVVDGNNLVTEANPIAIQGWEMSIERLRLRIIQNDIEYGNFKGKLKMDVSNTPLDYFATINYSRNQTQYTILAKVSQPLDFSLFGGSLSIDTTVSTVSVDVLNGNLRGNANLSGQFMFSDTIGSIPGVDIQGVRVNNLRLYTYSPYIGTASFEIIGDVPSTFGGFDIDIDSISLFDMPSSDGARRGQTPGVAKKALKFNANIVFGEADNGFNGDTKIMVKAKRNSTTKKWEFDGIEIDTLNIAGEVSSVSVGGKIYWFNNAIQGTGFQGKVHANFLDLVGLQSELLFGLKGSMQYWYVDGNSMFESPIPFGSGVGIMGFAGGAYSNMQSNGEITPSVIGGNNRASAYSPHQNGMGFKGGLILSTFPDPSQFNGFGLVEVEFDGKKMTRIQIDGDFAMLRNLSSDPASIDNPSMIRVNGAIAVGTTPNNHYLDANFGYDVNIPVSNPILYGRRLDNIVQMHFSSDYWKIWLGIPHDDGDPFRDMINLNFQLRYKVFGMNVGLPPIKLYSYFDMGTRLPNPPSLPTQISRHFDIGEFDRANGNSSGVMLGNHLSFDMPETKAFEIWDNGIYFKAEAGFGLDLAVRKLEGTLCNGSSDFGFDNWRAEGRGYFYGGAHLKGKIIGKKFNILGGEFQSVMMAKVPNPSYFGAGVRMRVDLPIYGGFTVKGAFEFGEDCDYTIDDTFMDELALQDILTTVSWNKNVDSVDCYDDGIKAQFGFALPAGHVEGFLMAGDTVLKTKVMYKISIRRITNNSNDIVAMVDLTDRSPVQMTYNERDNLRYHFTDNGKTLNVAFKDGSGNYILEPENRYKIEVWAGLYYAFGNDEFQILKKKANIDASEIKIKRFWTKKPDPTIITSVVSSAPAIMERFFYMGDFVNQKCFLTYSGSNVFNSYSDFNAQVIWTDLYSGETYTSGAEPVIGQTRIVYNLPRNQVTRLYPRKGRIYRVDFVVNYRTSQSNINEKVIYSYYFRTSHYQTYQEKINDLAFGSYRVVNRTSPTSKHYIITFRGKEFFGENENLDLSYNSLNNINNSISNWSTKRAANLVYASQNNLPLGGLTTEFSRNTSSITRQGNLTPGEVFNAQDQAPFNQYGAPINVAEANWKLNNYAYGLHLIVQFKRSATGLPILEYTSSPSLGKANISLNGIKQISFNINDMGQ